MYEGTPQRAPPVKAVVKKEIEIEPFDDGWPSYEEPAFEM